MKLQKLTYRVNYSIRNYYRDHKIVIYLPIPILLGFIIGVIISSKNKVEIPNFIDLMLNNEYNAGACIMKVLMLALFVEIASILSLVSRLFHVLGAVSLILMGYRFGYDIVSLVITGNMSGIIEVIIITVPLFLTISIISICFYAYIVYLPRLYCLKSTNKLRRVLINIGIYTLMYIVVISYFYSLIPKLYFLIFL